MLKLVIAEKQKVVREGIKTILAGHIVGTFLEAINGQQLVDLLDKHKVNLVIMEVDIKMIDGQCVANYVSKTYRSVRILIHSKYKADELVEYFILKGVKGFVTKDDDDLLTAASNIIKGGYYFSKSINTTCLKIIKGKLQEQFRSIAFTHVETCILNLSAQGQSSEEIAKYLGNKKSTIDFHRKQMIKKFKVRNFVELVHYAHLIGKLS